MITNLVVVAIGLLGAFRNRWICDDAFISFRYVDNLIAGHGLVYNVGERVEGYTHFLWLMLLVPFRRVGLDPILIGQALGLLAFAGTLLLFARISRRLFPSGRFALPLTSLLLAVHFDFQVWATGGLETSLFTFLVAASYYVLAVAEMRYPARALTGGLLLTLSVLLRPDGAIFLAVGGGYLLFGSGSRTEGLRGLLAGVTLFSIPAVGLLLPWLVFKMIYYGSILPNTYYAKSAGVPYYSQGIFYVYLYLVAYLSSVGLLLGPLAWIVGRVRGGNDGSQNRPLFLALLFLATYAIAFITRVGGDFMFARFLHPVIPFIYLCAEIGFRRWLRRGVLLYVAAGLLILLVASEKQRRDHLFLLQDGSRRGSYGVRGITDEHWYWSHQDEGQTLVEKHRAIGERLGRYFEGEDVRVLIGGQASLGYYGRFSLCIEYAGLTDSFIAHTPLRERGRPGHEKSPPDGYLESRGVHFVFLKAPFDSSSYRNAYFRMGDGMIRGEIFTYDRDLMRRLGERWPGEVLFIDFEAYLDEWIRRAKELTREELEASYRSFRRFYFLHNSDPEREARIISLLRRAR